MLRRELLCLLLFVFVATNTNSASSDEIGIGYFGDPIRRLNKKEQALFDKGFNTFTKVWSYRDGLGPTFNGTSCNSCHHIPLPGGTGFEDQAFVEHSVNTLDFTGGHTWQKFSISSSGVKTERSLANASYRRRTQPLFGIGLLEQVPSSFLEQLETRGKALGTNGRVAHLNKSGVGKFGWKCQISSLRQFTATAFNSEMGLTTKLYPKDSTERNRTEVDDSVLDSLVFFIQALGPPPKRSMAKGYEMGEQLFEQAGCAQCHIASLPQTDGSIIHPYTDLLLHDMGEGLAEGFTEGVARPSEFRTAPLWGAGSAGPPYLHDGRAQSLEQAISLHGGDAHASKTRFERLTVYEKKALIEFIKSI